MAPYTRGRLTPIARRVIPTKGSTMNLDQQNKVERDLEDAYHALQALVSRMVGYDLSDETTDCARDAIIALDRLWDYLNGWDPS